MNLIEFIYSHSNSLCQAENHNFKIQMLAGKKLVFISQLQIRKKKKSSLGTFFFQTKIQRLYTAVEPEALFDAENHLDF